MFIVALCFVMDVHPYDSVEFSASPTSANCDVGHAAPNASANQQCLVAFRRWWPPWYLLFFGTDMNLNDIAASLDFGFPLSI